MSCFVFLVLFFFFGGGGPFLHPVFICFDPRGAEYLFFLFIHMLRFYSTTMQLKLNHLDLFIIYQTLYSFSTKTFKGWPSDDGRNKVPLNSQSWLKLFICLPPPPFKNFFLINW